MAPYPLKAFLLDFTEVKRKFKVEKNFS